jgi:hypothetical protein
MAPPIPELRRRVQARAWRDIEIHALWQTRECLPI